MADRPSPTRAPRRARVLLGAAVGWILIVVAGGGADAEDSLLGAQNLEVVWVVFIGLAALLSLAFLIYLNPFANEWVEPEKSRRGFGAWTFLAIALLIWVWQPDFLSDLADEEALGGLSDFFDEEVDATIEEAAPETVAEITDLLLIAAVVAALGGAWYLLRRRARHVVETDGESSNLVLETALAQGLDEASMELGVIGDPRTAVLRAYAILEAVFATHGLSRSKAETPTEHVRRSLRDIRIDHEPVVALGRLYEIARFSDHAISPQQQAEAATALDQARASLSTVL